MAIEQVDVQTRKNVPQEVWDYVDWQMRNVDNERDLKFRHLWQFMVLGDNMEYSKVRKKINRIVTPEVQSWRNQGTPPALFTQEES